MNLPLLFHLFQLSFRIPVFWYYIPVCYSSKSASNIPVIVPFVFQSCHLLFISGIPLTVSLIHLFLFQYPNVSFSQFLGRGKDIRCKYSFNLFFYYSFPVIALYGSRRYLTFHFSSSRFIPCTPFQVFTYIPPIHQFPFSDFQSYYISSYIFQIWVQFSSWFISMNLPLLFHIFQLSSRIPVFWYVIPVNQLPIFQ